MWFQKAMHLSWVRFSWAQEHFDFSKHKQTFSMVIIFNCYLVWHQWRYFCHSLLLQQVAKIIWRRPHRISLPRSGESRCPVQHNVSWVPHSLHSKQDSMRLAILHTKAEWSRVTDKPTNRLTDAKSSITIGRISCIRCGLKCRLRWWQKFRQILTDLKKFCYC